MPVLALPLFWLVPPGVAGPIYLAVLSVSGGVYFFAMKAMRRPAITGPEALVGCTGPVVALHNGIPYVRLESEIWEVTCSEADLSVGDRACVSGVDGLTLVVRKLDTDSPPSFPVSAATALPAQKRMVPPRQE